MHMLVPGPARRGDEIAFLHQAFLAVDDGVGAFTLEHEAQRIGRMTMGPRALARLQDLQCGGQRRRRAHRRGRAQVGINERQHAALDRRHVLQVERVLDKGPHRLPFPDVRSITADLGRMRLELLPERRDMRFLPRFADMIGRCRGAGCAHAGLSHFSAAWAAAELYAESIDGWRRAAQFGYALGRFAKKDDRDKPCRALAKKRRAGVPRLALTRYLPRSSPRRASTFSIRSASSSQPQHRITGGKSAPAPWPWAGSDVPIFSARAIRPPRKRRHSPMARWPRRSLMTTRTTPPSCTSRRRCYRPALPWARSSTATARIFSLP